MLALFSSEAVHWRLVFLLSRKSTLLASLHEGEGFGFGTLLQKRRWGFGKGGLARRRRGKRAIWKGIAGYLRMAPKEVGRQINVASAAHGQVRDESLPIPCFRTPSITLGPH